MARPPKHGLDYFPHDTDTDHDGALLLLEAEHGLVGYAVYFKLLERVYGEHGWFADWREEDQLLFSKRNGIAPEVLASVVDSAARRGLFSERILASDGILTSGGIQRRFEFSTRKRTNCCIPAALTVVSDAETPVSGSSGTQRDRDRDSKEIVDAETPVSPALYDECHKALFSAFATFLNGPQTVKLKRLCLDYEGHTPTALERVEHGISKARDAGKPNPAYAIGCASSAGVEELQPVNVLPDEY